MGPSPQDHVTGLAPRGTLERELAEALATAPPRLPLALTIVDCIGLKAVNEREGFLAGDVLLAAAAARLRDAAGGARLVARLGGDEMVAVFGGATAAAAADTAARTLAAAGFPPLRAAAVAAGPGDTPASLVERLYATLRRS
jgi:diguanylate cyclase (GGDEF)-like protein